MTQTVKANPAVLSGTDPTTHLQRQHKLRSEILDGLNRCAADTGIHRRELRQMCLRAGLEQLQRGQLTVRAEKPDQRPLTLVFPLETFTALQRLASVRGEPVEDFATATLSKTAGTVELGAGDYAGMSREVGG